MKRKLKKVATLIVGWFFVFLGILGLFLPFLQGVLFLLIGLYILSLESVIAKDLLSYIKKRFPKINTKFEEARIKAKKNIKAILNIITK